MAKIDLAREKLDESEYFLQKLREVESSGGSQDEVRYLLSAFLSSCQSVCNCLKYTGIGSFKDWADSPKYESLHDFFKNHRDAVVHLEAPDSRASSVSDGNQRLILGLVVDVSSESQYHTFIDLPPTVKINYMGKWEPHGSQNPEESIPIEKLCGEYLSVLEKWVAEKEQNSN